MKIYRIGRDGTSAVPFVCSIVPRSIVPCLPAIAAAVAAALLLPASPARAITIDWVTVGDPGNAPDTTGSPNPVGAVADVYRIMKYEFTNSQYVEFLNAVDPDGTNPNDVYFSSMTSEARGGINFTSGNAPGNKYAAKTDMGDKPVNIVSWWDAARVANWLENGAPTSVTTDASASAPQNYGSYSVGTATSGTFVASVNAG